jgi:hypothetical protein
MRLIEQYGEERGLEMFKQHVRELRLLMEQWGL